MSLEREYQDLLASMLNAQADIPATAVVEDQPATIQTAQTALDTTGYFIGVAYPDVSYQQVGVNLFESAVNIMVNSNVATGPNAQETAGICSDALHMVSTGDDRWLETRVVSRTNSGEEGGVVVFSLKVQSTCMIVSATT